MVCERYNAESDSARRTLLPLSVFESHHMNVCILLSYNVHRENAAPTAATFAAMLPNCECASTTLAASCILQCLSS